MAEGKRYRWWQRVRGRYATERWVVVARPRWSREARRNARLAALVLQANLEAARRRYVHTSLWEPVPKWLVPGS